jgi:hypothetical protein
MMKLKPQLLRNRQQLLPPVGLLAQMAEAAPINTLPALRKHLQTAIELEHSTIPPYLCALYSLQDGDNVPSAQIIRSVVVEEMLHMILAANVLNAIDGKPSINHPRFIPEYPTYLPHSDKSFLVGLDKFSKSTIETFLKIEMPAEPDAPPEPNHYHTIGQFYAAIEDGLKRLSKDKNIFTGDRAKQITQEYYYGGGGGVYAVHDLDSALKALHEIVGQGEGVDQSIFDGDHRIFGEGIEYAHYFRYNEIHEERYYTKKDTPKSGPTGKRLPVNWKAVYNMSSTPKMKNFPKGSEIWQKMYEFNHTYIGLLNVLHNAFNGEPNLLLNGVVGMYELKYQAVELMKIPVNDEGQTAGPSFEYVPVKN